MWVGLNQLKVWSEKKELCQARGNPPADCLWTSSAPSAILGIHPAGPHCRFWLPSLYNHVSQFLIISLNLLVSLSQSTYLYIDLLSPSYWFVSLENSNTHWFFIYVNVIVTTSSFYFLHFLLYTMCMCTSNLLLLTAVWIKLYPSRICWSPNHW